MLFPRPAGDALTGVMINCAGGLTGGDKFSVEAVGAAGTKTTLTTQTAERIYRALGDPPARLTGHVTVEAGAQLNWLPQETILFDRSRFTRWLEVDLAPDARFLMVEPLVFGRTAMGEHLRDIWFSDQVRIRRTGQLIHADATRLEGDVEASLFGAAVTSGKRAVAAIVLACPKAEQHLDTARQMIGETGGVSLKGPDLLSIRLIAKDAFTLRRVAIPLIARLSGTDIPRTWTL